MKIAEQIKGYELRERIGAGGFGAVYRAYQSTVGREVAIKIILPGLANQPDFIRRFETEAQLVARLEHPHITPLYDYWRDPEGAYLVMRWLRGGSLRDTLQNGAFELRPAALLLEQIAGALALAHRNKVIHRDIKPGNILLDEDGNSYLTDFGIAKDLSVRADNTSPDAIVGSLDYISPEQARSEPLTGRTDIYSLGVTLYEMIVGQHPFEGISSVERLYKHINDPLPEISTLDGMIARDVNRVIQKATAKNPEHRYVDALAFAADFREAAGLNRTTSVVELLTKREQEILSLLIEGLSNKEIAQRLTMTVGTIKWYVNQIYTKLGVRGRVQAMVRARELDLFGRANGGQVTAHIPTEDFHPENPYKGLRAFQSSDSQDFFGREKLVSKLIAKMNGDTGTNRVAGHQPEQLYQRFLAIVGPSGSGKSSLVRAGMVPGLWRGELPGSEKWFIADMLPAARPVDELEVALTRVAANQLSNLHEHLRRDEFGLARVASLILPNDGTELVIVIDQFEEVFTLVEDEAERAHFLKLLYRAVTAPHSRVRVVVTLRADFYDRPLHYPEFGELVRSRLETILPLSAEELERAIAKPAERVGATFEPGLISTIVSDVNYQAGALPLLQYALTELFERRQGRILTHEAYQQIGGTVGALANRAEELYQGMDESGREAVRQIFLRLVTLGEGTADTRRRTGRSELLAIGGFTPHLQRAQYIAPLQHASGAGDLNGNSTPLPDFVERQGAGSELIEDILDTYAAYRLLTLDTDPGTRTPTVEVAHEALLREWERLRNWLNESRADIRQQRLLSYAAGEWNENKRDGSFLLMGSRLEQFEGWMGETQLALTPLERDYLAQSLKERERQQIAENERQAREAALEKRSMWFLRGLVAVFALSAIIAFGLMAVAVGQSNVAQTERNNAQRRAAEFRSIALTVGAQDELESGLPDTALSLAREAVNMENPPILARQTFFDVATSTSIRWRITEHTASLHDVDFSPDGQRAVTVGYDGMAIIWDVTTEQALQRLHHEGGRFVGAKFDPHGTTVALGTWDDSMLILWNLETNEIIQRPLGIGGVLTPTYSPDGKSIVVAGWPSGEIVLLDAQTGDVKKKLQGHNAAANSASFSPDGRFVASTDVEGTIHIIDVETNSIIQRLQHPENPYDNPPTIFRAQFLADGEHILTGGTDEKMYLWHWPTGKIVRTYEHEGQVQDISFGPGQRLVATADNFGKLYVWNVENGLLVRSGFAHRGRLIRNIEYNPDGTSILTASYDGTAVLWELYGAGVKEVIPTVIKTDWQAALSPTDPYIATTSWDSEIQIRELETGAVVSNFGSHNGPISMLAYSPDGRTIVSGVNSSLDGAGTAYVWDATAGKLITVLDEHRGGVEEVVFSPDGSVAAIAEGQGARIILWDTETWQPLRMINWRWTTALAISHDGQKLYAGSLEGIISVWDVATGESLGDLTQGNNLVQTLSLNQDGSRLLATIQPEVIIWDTVTGERVATLVGHAPYHIFDAIYSPDDQYILSSSEDSTLILWDAETFEPIQRLVGHTDYIWGGYFIDDGQTILSVSVHELIRWDMGVLLEGYKSWTIKNRYIPDFSCEQRELYRIEPLCEAESS